MTENTRVAPDENWNEKWNIGVRHALYRKNGTWYHRLERFPGALCDARGYVRFETEDDLVACPGVLIGKEKNWLSVPAGIATLPGYVWAERQPLEKRQTDSESAGTG